MTAGGSGESRWALVESLLREALDQPPESRDAFIRDACAGDADLQRRLERLLAADAATGGPLDQPLDELAAGLADQLEAGLANTRGLAPGSLIGAYRILGELGHGGMGVVFLAERADGSYRQQVALKIVRGGLVGAELQQRFLRERRILARLRHPGIAGLLDAGVTAEGTLFLVMERVDGEPITQWADSRGLDLQARLALFMQVCEAVEHAHRSLVVHRDLKPANILVTDDGQVRLLDFGVARLLDPDDPDSEPVTRAGGLAATPGYAAPEQLRGDPPTTAVDVHALGAVLYELLCGARPYTFDSTDPAAVIAATETRPPPPSRHARLPADLDAIALMALASDPARRYGSPSALADDLRRFLRHAAVRAQPDSVRYRLGKFVRRHRQGVAVAAALAVALAGGFAATAWQAHQRGLEARKAEAAKQFVLDLFAGADPARARGADLSANDIVAEGARRIGSEFQDQPEVRAEILLFLAELYGKLGQRDTALAMARESHALDPTTQALVVQGGLLIEGGERDAGIALLEQALPMLETEPLLRAEAWDQRAIAHRQAGELPAALQLVEQSLALREATLGAEHLLVAQSLNNLGVLSREAGDFSAASGHHGRALVIRRRALPANHPEIGISLNNLGALAVAQGDYAAAEQYLGEALRLNEEVHGAEHPLTITALNNVGSVYRRQERYAEARAAFERALAYWIAGPGDMHPNALVTRHNLAMVSLGEGDLADAAALFDRLLVDAPRVFGPEHALVAAVQHGYASVLFQRGDQGRALEMHRSALGLRLAALGGKHPEVADSLHETAVVELALGNVDEARALLEQALAIQDAALEPGHPALARTRDTLDRLPADPP